MDLDSVKKAIRAVLQSSKQDILSNKLQRQFKEITGSGIPHRDFGFQTLGAFLKSIPDTVKMYPRGDTFLLKSVGCEETSHIESLVKGQKDSKKKPGRIQMPNPIRFNKLTYSCNNTTGATTAPRLVGTRRNLTKNPGPNSHHNQNHLTHLRPIIKRSHENFKTCRQEMSINLESPKMDNISFNASSRSNINEMFESCNMMPTMTANQNFMKQETIYPMRTMKNEDKLYKESGRVTPTQSATRKASIYSASRASTPEATFKSRLRQLAMELDASEPVYKSISYKENYGRQTNIKYIGKVEVCGQGWHSHPNSFSSPDDAEEEAAKKAYDALQKSKMLMNRTESPNLKRKEEILNSIIDIVSKSKRKLMACHGVEKSYFELFSEHLPSDWVCLVRESSKLVVEEENFSNQTRINIGIPIKPKTQDSPLSPIPNTPTGDSSPFDLDRLMVQEMPDSLMLPGTETWDVIVTKVVSLNEVIVRLISESDKYATFADNMHSFYSNLNGGVAEAIDGKIYVAVYQEASFRVHLISTKDKIATCVFLDEGGTDDIPLDKIREIDSKFMRLPFQAFSCSLHGLENYNCEIGLKMLRNIVESVKDSAFIALPINRDDPISIKLYDTSMDIDRDINQELILSLKKVAFDYLFNKSGSEAKVVVVYCTYSGDIYVQVEEEFYSNFNNKQEMVNMICWDCNIAIPSTIEAIQDKDLLSLKTPYALYERNWCRIEILKYNSNNNQAYIFYLDYGNEGWVELSDIRLIHLAQDPLLTIPYLAIKVRLDKVPNDANYRWCEKTVNKFMELYEINESLAMKVIHGKTGDCPARVDLFRTPRNSDPIVINLKLASYKECFEVRMENGSDTGVRRGNIPKPIMAPLSQNGCEGKKMEENKSFPRSLSLGYKEKYEIDLPSKSLTNGSDWLDSFEKKKIPDIVLPPIQPNPVVDEDYFDVRVTVAPNPHHFVVQSYKNRLDKSSFSKMERDMREHYEMEENKAELAPSLIKKGLVVAAKFEDGVWYRVSVEGILSEDPMQMMCYFLDYGDLHPVSLENMQPLYSKFKDVPVQGIKASLANVIPANGHDWDVLACYEFSRMVENKNFVSIVHGIREGKLQLSLIDTSGDTETAIDQMLIRKRFAQRRIYKDM